MKKASVLPWYSAEAFVSGVIALGAGNIYGLALVSVAKPTGKLEITASLHPLKPDTTMKALLMASGLLLLSINSAFAQTKVAGYSFGKPGTATYEHLSFWVKDGKRTDIYYAYGKDRKEVKLNYLKGDKPGFDVQFSNGHTLSIMPSGALLKVTDVPGKAPKSFAWEYEGPVNGIGTFCEPCAADEKEAMQLMRTHYLK